MHRSRHVENIAKFRYLFYHMLERDYPKNDPSIVLVSEFNFEGHERILQDEKQKVQYLASQAQGKEDSQSQTQVCAQPQWCYVVILQKRPTLIVRGANIQHTDPRIKYGKMQDLFIISTQSQPNVFRIAGVTSQNTQVGWGVFRILLGGKGEGFAKHKALVWAYSW